PAVAGHRAGPGARLPRDHLRRASAGVLREPGGVPADERRLLRVAAGPAPHAAAPARGLPAIAAGRLAPVASRPERSVLVVHGDHDAIPVEASRAWVAALPDARLLVVPGADHLPWL